MTNYSGVIVTPSQYTVDDTINRLVIHFQKVGIKVYARINQQTEALGAGIELLPIEFILFGNPKRGSLLISQNPVTALNLPMKLICWQDRDESKWVAYNAATFIEKRYLLKDGAGMLVDIDKLVQEALA